MHQPLLVLCKLLFRVPFVCTAACDKDRGKTLQFSVADIGRDVSTHRNYVCGTRTGIDCGAKCGRDSLRETCENSCRQRRPLRRDGFEAGLYVRNVIGDGQLAVLTRHPTGHNPVRAPLVEAVKPLNRHDEPAFASRNSAQAIELCFGIFSVPVKAHQKRRRTGGPRRIDEIAAVGRGCDDVFSQRAMLATNGLLSVRYNPCLDRRHE